MAQSAETVKDLESGVITGTRLSKLFGVFSPIFIQAFTLTFLAEWGDRSQITTIVLGASEVNRQWFIYTKYTRIRCL